MPFKALDELKKFPLATREQILATALRNLHEEADQYGIVMLDDVEDFLASAVKDFSHAEEKA